MTVQSMTGFARSDGADDRFRWHWELKTVNGRSLDLRSRLGAFDSLEPRIRAAAGAALSRGSMTASLQITALAQNPHLRINTDTLRQLLDEVRAVAAEFDLPSPSLDTMLSLRGVLESGDIEEDAETVAARQDRIFAGFEQALAALLDARIAEGTRLDALARSHLDAIEELVERARAAAAAQPNAIRDRLRQQMADLMNGHAISEDRLAQEAAILATKADIREELDRLTAHVASARDLLTSGGPVGRKLDFLAQEFNREANTFCSKTSDIDLKSLGLDLKAVIEQLREQIQNIE